MTVPARADGRRPRARHPGAPPRGRRGGRCPILQRRPSRRGGGASPRQNRRTERHVGERAVGHADRHLGRWRRDALRDRGTAPPKEHRRLHLPGPVVGSGLPAVEDPLTAIHRQLQGDRREPEGKGAWSATAAAATRVPRRPARRRRQGTARTARAPQRWRCRAGSTRRGPNTGSGATAGATAMQPRQESSRGHHTHRAGITGQLRSEERERRQSHAVAHGRHGAGRPHPSERRAEAGTADATTDRGRAW